MQDVNISVRVIAIGRHDQHNGEPRLG